MMKVFTLKFAVIKHNYLHTHTFKISSPFDNR